MPALLFLLGQRVTVTGNFVLIVYLLLAVALTAVSMWYVYRLKCHFQYLERAREHMDRLEEGTERMVVALESIDRKLGDRESET